MVHTPSLRGAEVHFTLVTRRSIDERPVRARQATFDDRHRVPAHDAQEKSNVLILVAQSCRSTSWTGTGQAAANRRVRPAVETARQE